MAQTHQYRDPLIKPSDDIYIVPEDATVEAERLRKSKADDQGGHDLPPRLYQH
eukprot:m.176013 g.176013  ORF g.176013 m.176013 type:complete len:53 (+) comp16793_c0_seq1:709-867(+)